MTRIRNLTILLWLTSFGNGLYAEEGGVLTRVQPNDVNHPSFIIVSSTGIDSQCSMLNTGLIKWDSDIYGILVSFYNSQTPLAFEIQDGCRNYENSNYVSIKTFYPLRPSRPREARPPRPHTGPIPKQEPRKLKPKSRNKPVGG